MASTAGSPSSEGLGKNLQLGSISHESQKLNLTIEDVYELGKDIAQEMQKITADYGNSCLEGLVEKVVKSLECLENYIEEIEELRKSKCKLMLKEDELACEKERRRKLQLDLKVRQTERAFITCLHIQNHHICRVVQLLNKYIYRNNVCTHTTHD